MIRSPSLLVVMLLALHQLMMIAVIGRSSSHDVKELCQYDLYQIGNTHPYTNIFIDMGANYGSSIEGAHKKGWIDYKQSTAVFMFEPNAMHFRSLTSILHKNKVPGQLIPMAAWVEDTLLKFYVHVGEPVYHNGLLYDSESSSLFDRSHAKAKPVHGVPVVVCAMDVTTWIINEISPSQNVTIKMDIEGAEFEVLDRLLKYPEALKRIDALLIEWHGFKLRPDICSSGSTCFAVQQKLTKSLTDAGVHVVRWDE